MVKTYNSFTANRNFLIKLGIEKSLIYLQELEKNHDC